MGLVTTFWSLLQPLAVVMTVPSFKNFNTVVAGRTFTHRRTVTGMIVAANAVNVKHHSAFHRLFAAARWSRDELGFAVLKLIVPWLNKQVLLGIDDTLARKRGLKMFGCGMHHDPLLSSRSKTITNWGHSWVVLGVIVRFPLWPERPFCLPILFRLYLNKAKAKKHRRAYRTRPELAVEMISLLCRRFPQRRFHVLGDSAYGGKSVLAHLPKNCDLTSRLVKNARLYDAPPAPKPGRKGRPRRRGQRLPTPMQMLDQRCRHVSLDIYGRSERARLAEAEARVFAVPDRPLRVVAVEATKGGRGQEAFYSTCHDATAEEIIGWYAMRWSIEVAFQDSKQHLGFEEPQGWTRKAVERTAPVAMLLYSLIVLWFVEEGHRHYRPIERPWYRRKPHASFADMLGTLRRMSVRQYILSLGLTGPGSRKTLQILENAVAMAA
jgi:hypothetical protein